MSVALSILRNFLFSSLTEAVRILLTGASRVEPRPLLNEEKTFTYYSRPVYQLGVRGGRTASAITPDGTLQTHGGEFIILLGRNNRDLSPVHSSIWEPYKGYLPMYQTEVATEGVSLKASMFQFFDDSGAIPLNYVKIIATSRDGKSISLGLGYCYALSKDHRPLKLVKFSKGPYKFKDDCLLVGDRILYCYGGKPHYLMRRVGEEYDGPFFVSSPREIIGMTVFHADDLRGGETLEATFAVPIVPVRKKFSWDFDRALKEFERYWEEFLNRATKIKVPEEKVTNAYRMSLIYNLMSQDVEREGIAQKVNRFQYNDFWIRDSSFIAKMFLVYGLPDIAKDIIRYIFSKQRPDGLIASQRGQLDGIGQALWIAGEYVTFTQDAEFAREIVSKVRRAVLWIAKAVSRDPLHVMPSTFALDNEFVVGRYVGHTIWAINGLMGAEKVAELAGDESLLKLIRKLRPALERNFRTLLKWASRVWRREAPPAFDVPFGEDWGNLLLLYPSRVVDDETARRAVARYVRERLREMIATYGAYLHGYLGERVAQDCLALGMQECALAIFYGMLLHTGSAHGGFEWCVPPWGSRDYVFKFASLTLFENYPPHGWFATNLNLLLRNMLIREDGDTLHILSAVPPAWFRPGDGISVEGAPTAFGRLDLKVSVEANGFRVTLRGDWRAVPERTVIHVPYFARPAVGVEGEGEVSKDGAEVITRGGDVELFVHVQGVRGNLSYKNVVKLYINRYKRLLQKGGGWVLFYPSGIFASLVRFLFRQ